MPGIAEILAQKKYAIHYTKQDSEVVGQTSLFGCDQAPQGRHISQQAERSYRAFEEAERFGIYVGISPKTALSLFKKYGKQRVLSQQAFLRDAPQFAQNGKKTNKVGLLVWKLKKDSGSL